MASALDKRLLTHIENTGLFAEPGKALLAVSGGPDSVALLDLLYSLADNLRLELAVIHVDHGISTDSADVAESVMALAVRYKVRGYLATLNLGAGASETRARAARYAELRNMQGKVGARYLVTAHHRDDQVETVLFRVLKGSGLAGLAGIKATGVLGLVRPLLPFSRAELTRWLKQSLTFRTCGYQAYLDPANMDTRHDRVWIRQDILPRLRERFGDDLSSGLLDVANHAAANREAWSSLLHSFPELDFRESEGGCEVARLPLRRYDKVLSVAILQALARECGCRLGASGARRAADFVLQGASGRWLDLGRGWKIEIVFDRVRCARVSKELGDTGDVSWGEGSEGCVEWGDWKLDWRIDRAGETKRTGYTTWVTPGPGRVRGLREGDRIVPLGGVGHRKARRLLMEARVPREQRWVYPIVERNGEIIWIPGVCRTAVQVPQPGEEALRIDASRI